MVGFRFPVLLSDTRNQKVKTRPGLSNLERVGSVAIATTCLLSLSNLSAIADREMRTQSRF